MKWARGGGVWGGGEGREGGRRGGGRERERAVLVRCAPWGGSVCVCVCVTAPRMEGPLSLSSSQGESSYLRGVPLPPSLQGYRVRRLMKLQNQLPQNPDIDMDTVCVWCPAERTHTNTHTVLLCVCPAESTHTNTHTVLLCVCPAERTHTNTHPVSLCVSSREDSQTGLGTVCVVFSLVAA